MKIGGEKFEKGVCHITKICDITFKTSHEHVYILVGATRSYSDAFKRVRDARIDRFVVETNKLLIRLDKLMSPDAPSDPAKRKGKASKCLCTVRYRGIKICNCC